MKYLVTLNVHPAYVHMHQSRRLTDKSGYRFYEFLVAFVSSENISSKTNILEVLIPLKFRANLKHGIWSKFAIDQLQILDVFVLEYESHKILTDVLLTFGWICQILKTCRWHTIF